MWERAERLLGFVFRFCFFCGGGLCLFLSRSLFGCFFDFFGFFFRYFFGGVCLFLRSLFRRFFGFFDLFFRFDLFGFLALGGGFLGFFLDLLCAEFGTRRFARFLCRTRFLSGDRLIVFLDGNGHFAALDVAETF